MATILLPILPGQLPNGYCFSSWQQTLVDFSNAQKAVLENGRSFYNFGDQKPAPEFQAYPWLRTVDGRWYVFSGVWQSPVNYSGSERRLWVGSEADLVSYDGGSAGPVSTKSGPMWVVDHSFDDRIPIGAKSTVANPLDTAGAKDHTLTPEEMQHFHGVATDANTDDPAAQLSRPWVSGGTAYGERVNDMNPTGASGYADNGVNISSGTMGSTKALADPLETTKAFSLIPPVIGLFVIKPSGRAYYTVA